MKLSIFTPTHDTRWLPEAYQSIRDQPFDEWVVLYNNGAKAPEPDGDARIQSVQAGRIPAYVGALKAAAIEHCTGDILLELDHDDLLMPGAIAAVKEAFEHHPEVGFVYSNTIQMNHDGSPRARFQAAHGWHYRPVTVRDSALEETVAFPPTPASISRIWYAPDHLRAFRREAYELAGGYNPEMRVLDDQDLMARLYQVASFHHIDQPLYVYRVHGDNAWLRYHDEIQQNVMRLYDANIEALALTWARRKQLRCLDLGGRLNRRQGYECVDLREADVVCDLNKKRWPFADNSVGVVRAFDVFEHLKQPLRTMRELYRILAPGGYAFIQVPSTDGRGAFQDPTHVSFWNENSFAYYAGQKAYWIDKPVRFQALRLYTTPHDAEGVCWARADLMKLVDGMRVPGPVSV